MKGRRRKEIAEKRQGVEEHPPAGLFCSLDEKSLPLISRRGLLSKPPRLLRELRRRDQRTVNRSLESRETF